MQVTERDDTACNEDEDESCQSYDLANSILSECNDAASLADLETAIYLFGEALDRCPLQHPLRSESLRGLAGALVTRFSVTNQLEDLDQVILLRDEIFQELRNTVTRTGGQSQLDRVSAEHDSMFFAGWDNTEASELSKLATATLVNFNQMAPLTDLNTAVTLHREVILLRPSPHLQRLVSLGSLAAVLYARFRRTGDVPNLDEAIVLLREAVEACPESHACRVDLLSNLSAALATRFGQTGQLLDLFEAKTRRSAIFHVTSMNDNGGTVGQLLNIATNLTAQFQHSGRISDLDKAISLFRQCLTLLPPHHRDRFVVKGNLASALLARFTHLGQYKDLDEGISINRDMLRLPHPDRYKSLNNLAGALRIRFDRSGQREELDEAVSMYREALELWPSSDTDLSSILINIGGAIYERFNQSGQRQDLDEALLFYRNSLELRPAGHPFRSRSLNNIADALIGRFKQLNQLEDLDEAISVFRDTLNLQPIPHPERATSLNNLAHALGMQYDRSGKYEDLEEAISLQREALKLFPISHPRRAGSLNNLAGDLNRRFIQSVQIEDLDQAISLLRDALELRPAPHPLRYTSLNNLASMLKRRFGHSGQLEDLDEAIDVYTESIDVLPNSHPGICQVSANLGEALVNKYSRTQDSEYLDKAMAAYRVASTCDSAPATQRFTAAKSWACHAGSKHKSALDAYRIAIELLPRLATLSLDLQSRQQALKSGSDGLARDAAACAIRLGHYDNAVEFLEEGRAVFWSQALQLRTPMTDLRDKAPELAEKLSRLSLALEQGSLRDTHRNPSDNPMRVKSMEQEASYFCRLNDEWLGAVEDIRQLDGFQDFLCPSRLSVLQSAASNGPVVILNASKTGCAGLILTSNGVQHIPFPTLDFADLIVLVKLIHCATAKDSRGVSFPESSRVHLEGLIQQVSCISNAKLPLERHVRRASNISAHPDDIFRYVLATLWLLVVEPIIQSQGLKKSNIPPNLWWCPTGPFAFLPIHAAGMYFTDEMECCSEYIVSSYTPTIGTLLSNIPPPTKSFKMMAVIQCITPGQIPLPCTLDELQKIETHVPAQALVKLVPGSIKDVTCLLPDISIAHFAGHGEQKSKNPLESALLLQDGPLKVSQIMQQFMPNASLAFLSACETAMGDEELPDEVIHLSATLLFAGFRGVIATMWSIADADGPKITDTFYENLFKDYSFTSEISGPDASQAALALHHAVSKLRSENVSFVRWVPFVHLGR